MVLLTREQLLTIVGAALGAIWVEQRARRKADERAMLPRRHGGRSSLREPGRHVTVVTTAAIPWMTGTAVNPCLRAAYLAHCTDLQVTLLIPWLSKADQATVFNGKHSFDRPEQQTACIRDWLQARCGFEPACRMVYYPGRYDHRLLGIFAVGDITSYITNSEADVAILEEPEHLTWFHHGLRWTDKFNHVVGVMHTNYKELGKRIAGPAVCPLVHGLVSALCGIHCHKVIKLSDGVQRLPRQVTRNVHGAARSFLEVGEQSAQTATGGKPRFTKGAYVLGKIVWGKGWEELLELLAAHCAATGPLPQALDAFGTGEAAHAIQKLSCKRGLNIHFLGARDHLDPSLRQYQVFLNCSTSDVVATTSLEALAMGKWVVAAEHPCNAFIAHLPNCLIYTCPEEFSQHLQTALEQEPAPLSPEDIRMLSWEGAVERLLDVAELQPQDWPRRASFTASSMLYTLYNTTLGEHQMSVVSVAACCL
eukprot:jgi/Astpho2/2916/Aster-01063